MMSICEKKDSAEVRLIHAEEVIWQNTSCELPVTSYELKA